MKQNVSLVGGALALAALGFMAARCAPSAPKTRKAAGAVSDLAVSAQKTYIAPGDLDEFYMFSSGGHSGQVYVYGVPSMCHNPHGCRFMPDSANSVAAPMSQVTCMS